MTTLLPVDLVKPGVVVANRIPLCIGQSTLVFSLAGHSKNKTAIPKIVNGEGRCLLSPLACKRIDQTMIDHLGNDVIVVVHSSPLAENKSNGSLRALMGAGRPNAGPPDAHLGRRLKRAPAPPIGVAVAYSSL
jgi:hypothetical protein